MFRIKKTLLIIIASALVLAACNQSNPLSLDVTITARNINADQATVTPVAKATISTQTAEKPTQQPTEVSATQPSSAMAPATPTPGVDPNRLTGLTIQFWHPWSGETARTINDLVELFNLSNETGIKVETRAPGSLENLATETDKALLDGKAPDLIASYLFQALEWDEQKPLIDLNPYLSDQTWGLSATDQADFYPVFWDAGLSGKERLGLPVLGSGQVLYYNQSWAEELGFSEPPTTPEQLITQACRAAQANNQDDSVENDHTGGLILSTQYSPMLGWLHAFGGEVFDPSKATGKSSPYNFSSPQVVEAFTFLRRMYDQGCAWLPDEPAVEQEFASRRGLFAAASIANVDYLSQLMAHSVNNDRWTIIPFPSSDGKPVIDVYAPALEIFSSTRERQLAAWLFARWLLSPENQARLVEASHGYPVRKSALEHLQDYQAGQPKWADAQQYLEYARLEPTARSWKTVRWALSDAATQLFRSYFTIDQTPELAKFLNQTAADLHRNPP